MKWLVVGNLLQCKDVHWRWAVVTIKIIKMVKLYTNIFHVVTKNRENVFLSFINDTFLLEEYAHYAYSHDYVLSKNHMIMF